MSPAGPRVDVLLQQRLPGGSCIDDCLALMELRLHEGVGQGHIDLIDRVLPEVVDCGIESPLQIGVGLFADATLLSREHDRSGTWKVGTSSPAAIGAVSGRGGTYSPRPT
jgi:hypothetical protein